MPIDRYRPSKIASIRQIAVMTDAGISIHDAVDDGGLFQYWTN